MSKIGVHSFVWSAGSSQGELEKALEYTHQLGYKLIEFSYLDPRQVDVKWLSGRLGELGLDVAISMGLPPEGDISSADPAIVTHGVDILDRAVALVRDLGGTKLAGILSSAHGKQEHSLSRKGWDTSVAALSKVAERAKAGDEALKTAPHFAPRARLDETLAARKPILVWKEPEAAE